MLHLKIYKILIDSISQLVDSLSGLKMHVHLNTNDRKYAKMLSFHVDKMLLVRLENVAQGKENEFLFIKTVHSEHARSQNMLLRKNSQFPNANYNKTTFMCLRYSHKAMRSVNCVL